MIYLDSFTFPDTDAEWAFRMGIKRTCYNTMYPFGVLTKAGLSRLDFAPVTILCGGNGYGKSTALNVIAEALHLRRETPFNRSSFFDDYVKLCRQALENPVPEESRIITSDDVFDYMLDMRALNEGIDREKEGLFDDYVRAKHTSVRVRSLDDYDALKKQNSARSKTQSAFVRGQLMENAREQSNGESSDFYFKQRIGMDALYLLDEPENSLAPERQIELAAYLAETARYMGCQLVISTHSPFLLAIPGAKIYDLDANPASVKKWTALPGARACYDFFMSRRDEFESSAADD